MKVEQLIISVLSVASAGLLAIIGYFLKDFFIRDEKWKTKTASRTYDIEASIGDLRSKISSVSYEIMVELKEAKTFQQTMHIDINNNLKAAVDILELQIKELESKVFKAEEKLDMGKILLIEKKVAIVYEALVKAKGSRQ